MRFIFPSRVPIICVILITYFSPAINGQSISDTFDTSEIPTNFGSFSSSCNGPLTKISITLPSGGPWNVTSVDVAYNMTAQSGGFKSHQRSYIRCQNTATSESTVAEGTGNTGGVQNYNRPGLTIANGFWPASTTLDFEMRAWRTDIGSGCNTTFNKVDNFTWIITVHYSLIPDEGSVGIGTTTPAPSAILDLSSTTQAFLPPRLTTAQRDAIAQPVDGMMIFNTTTKKLEIYASGWSSITFSAPHIKTLLGGSNSEVPFSMKLTSEGGFILTAYTYSSNSGTLVGLTNNGETDVLVIKLNNDGQVSWQKLYGGNDLDIASYINQTSDGGYIIAGASLSSNTGTLAGVINNGFIDGMIIRLDANGNIVWQKLLGGTDEDRAFCIEETSDGGFIVTGSSNSSNTGTLTGVTSNGMTDVWIFKLDSNGNTVWQKLLGGNSEESSFSVRQLNDGNYIVSATSNSSNSGTLTGLTNNGEGDLWIMKLDPNGNIIWQNLYGGSLTEIAQNIEETDDGGFLVAATTTSSNTGTLAGLTGFGSNDYWIVKLTDNGVIDWQKVFGGTNSDQPQYIQPTTDGGCIISGYSQSSNTGTLTGLTNMGGFDFWTIKLNGSGIINWHKLHGGTGDEIGYAVVQHPDGGYVLIGDTTSSNSGTLLGLINNGGQDIWIYKIDPNGNP